MAQCPPLNTLLLIHKKELDNSNLPGFRSKLQTNMTFVMNLGAVGCIHVNRYNLDILDLNIIVEEQLQYYLVLCFC